MLKRSCSKTETPLPILLRAVRWEMCPCGFKQETCFLSRCLPTILLLLLLRSSGSDEVLNQRITVMAASNYSLKVNRDLLDPNFESYRLSLDPIPTYSVQLDAGETELTANSWLTDLTVLNVLTANNSFNCFN